MRVPKRSCASAGSLLSSARPPPRLRSGGLVLRLSYPGDEGPHRAPTGALVGFLVRGRHAKESRLSCVIDPERDSMLQPCCNRGRKHQETTGEHTPRRRRNRRKYAEFSYRTECIRTCSTDFTRQRSLVRNQHRPLVRVPQTAVDPYRHGDAGHRRSRSGGVGEASNADPGPYRGMMVGQSKMWVLW